MSWFKDLKHDLKHFGEPRKPRAHRLPPAGLSARIGSEQAPAAVKDISSSGIYLFTQKRLQTGELVTLTLEQQSRADGAPGLEFSIHARAAREGQDGLGLSFVLPHGMNGDLWAVLVRNIVSLTNPQQIEEMFHSLRTILFLHRICGDGAEQSILLLGGQTHPDRKAKLFQIAFQVEMLLDAQPGSDRMRAHPTLVANILRDGSWASEDFIRSLWAGLLAASCSTSSPDNSNQALADLLGHLTPNQARIFLHACETAIGASGESTSPDSVPSVILTPRRMIELTGVYDPYRNGTDLAYLYNLGLIRKLFDFTSYQEVDSFDITPSRLGIELYRRCHGLREPLDPELVQSARTHLAAFFPEPIAVSVDIQSPPLAGPLG